MAKIPIRIKFNQANYFKNISSDNPKTYIAAQLYSMITMKYSSLSEFTRVSGVNRKTLYNILNEKDYLISQLLECLPWLGDKGARFEITFIGGF